MVIAEYATPTAEALHSFRISGSAAPCGAFQNQNIGRAKSAQNRHEKTEKF